MPRFSTRRTCEQRLALDVRYLARHGMLEPGPRRTLTWYRGDQRTGAVRIKGYGNGIILEARVWTGECWRPVEQRLNLASTHCNLGGQRPWFLCPDCGRRCAIVYSVQGWFTCRLCARLNYESQRTMIREGARNRLRAIRQRLGASGNLLEPFPPRPKGMHRRTYDRLRQEADRLEAVHYGRLAAFLGANRAA